MGLLTPTDYGQNANAIAFESATPVPSTTAGSRIHHCPLITVPAAPTLCARAFGNGKACAPPHVPDPEDSWIPVRDGHSARADLDQNGRVDWRDVELFELRHRLSGELSRKMRD